MASSQEAWRAVGRTPLGLLELLAAHRAALPSETMVCRLSRQKARATDRHRKSGATALENLSCCSFPMPQRSKKRAIALANAATKTLSALWVRRGYRRPLLSFYSCPLWMLPHKARRRFHRCPHWFDGRPRNGLLPIGLEHRRRAAAFFRRSSACSLLSPFSAVRHTRAHTLEGGQAGRRARQGRAEQGRTERQARKCVCCLAMSRVRQVGWLAGKEADALWPRKVG